MMYRVSQYYVQSLKKRVGIPSLSVSRNKESKRWLVAVSSVVIGLLVLYVFLAMGGIFAYVGPWMIIAGIQSAMNRSKRKALSFLAGSGFLVLGIAAFLLPTHAGIWNIFGGVLGLLCGLRYLGSALIPRSERH